MKYSPSVIIVVLVIGVLLIFAFYPSSTSHMSSEINPAYSDTAPNTTSFEPSQPFNSDGYNSIDSYAKATGIQSSIIQPPMSDNRQQSIQNPAELLPRPEGQGQGQWAVSTPNGQGELMNINLLKAGFHAGINTIGSSNRNANLQLRSEPPNPQTYSGPWNNSTITQDAVRRPVLEIGQGPE
jgi:hypothetical protein